MIVIAHREKKGTKRSGYSESKVEGKRDGKDTYYQQIQLWHITKTRVFKYIETFTTKEGKFSDKKKNPIFFILLLKT